MSFVRVRDVWQSYGPRPILARVSLEAAEGEFVSIVGASGCGKSTFLRLLLAQERPDRGEIAIDGAPPATAASPFNASRRSSMFHRPTEGPRDRSRSHHPADRRHHHPDLTKLAGWKAARAEADIPGDRWAQERAWALRMG